MTVWFSLITTSLRRQTGSFQVRAREELCHYVEFWETWRLNEWVTCVPIFWGTYLDFSEVTLTLTSEQWVHSVYPKLKQHPVNNMWCCENSSNENLTFLLWFHGRLSSHETSRGFSFSGLHYFFYYCPPSFHPALSHLLSPLPLWVQRSLLLPDHRHPGVAAGLAMLTNPSHGHTGVHPSHRRGQQRTQRARFLCGHRSATEPDQRLQPWSCTHHQSLPVSWSLCVCVCVCVWVCVGVGVHDEYRRTKNRRCRRMRLIIKWSMRGRKMNSVLFKWAEKGVWKVLLSSVICSSSFSSRVDPDCISPDVKKSIHVGDRILEINGTPIYNVPLDEVFTTLVLCQCEWAIILYCKYANDTTVHWMFSCSSAGSLI